MRDRDADRVVGLLAGHLLACPWVAGPGVDGASAAEVVAAAYPAAVARGWVPRPTDLAARHPELADALRAFFPSTPTGLAG